MDVDGGDRYESPDESAPSTPTLCVISQVVDASGDVFEFGGLDGEISLFELSPAGEVRWVRPTVASQRLVLSDDHTLFAISTNDCFSVEAYPPATLSAFDALTGEIRWHVGLPDGASPDSNTNLALTPGATLLMSNGSRIYAIFAGQERPSSTAP